MQKDYFKGCYFKCSNETQTIAFIPAFHRSDHRETAFLQIIMDDVAFNLPFDSLEFQEKPLSVRIGYSIFSEKGIRLNIRTDKLSIYGTLHFGKLSPLRYDIMGPFQFVPFMQCRHSVFSMGHRVDGQLTINGQVYNFQNGMGYIEGDCGTSFPERYIWTQCSFPSGSLMLSVADIPLYSLHFTGIIGVVMLNGKEHRIATYLGARMQHIGKNTVTVKQGEYTLTAKLLTKNAHPLLAPDHGNMNRTIHESASCKASYRFSHKEKILCEFTSDRASFEFEYQ